MFLQFKVINGPVHKGKEFTFQNGETAIVGPNGCGKSLLAEYMAFSLFGTVALRGKVTDYKNLSVAAVVKIKGKIYTIKRDTKTCEILNEASESVCLGTKPCNIKIISLLGYDFNVYKMGNYAGQLDILGLGKMKPSERKTALDRTLGIGIIDKLIKYANDIALKNRHESDALKGILVKPDSEPVPPTNYREGLLKELYDQYHTTQESINDYKKFKEMKQPEQPSLPTKMVETELDSRAFLEKVLERQKLETELLSLKEVKDSQYTREYLDSQVSANLNYDRYEKYLKSVATFTDEEPFYTDEQLDLEQTAYENWKRYDEDVKNYELQQITCPKCNNVFNPFKNEPSAPLGDRPVLDASSIQKQRELLAKKRMRESIPVVEQVEKPELELKTIYSEQEKLGLFENAQEKILILEKELPSLSLYTRENLERLQEYEKAVSVYNERIQNFEAEYQKWLSLNVQYSEFNLPLAETRLNELAVYYDNVRKYEEQKKDYDQKYAEYMRIYEKALEMDRQETRYKTAVDNLKAMKVKIKGYVLPSLQKVSSILLSEMSDGLFQKIEIDPEFNILVEGREIGLFSGSEQAMINLALRLGLGQVLTHRAFSVFIGDEIDASMRDERAQLTADCLRKISKYINQVILISHRDIEADHFINLGDK